MKDFIEDVKAGFYELPEVSALIIIAGLIASVFGGIDGALMVSLFLFGVWAIIFIGFPFVILILGVINHLFGLEETNKKHSK